VQSRTLGRAAAALVAGGLVFAGVAAPASADSFDPTTLTINAAPSSVTAGQEVSISGTLTDSVTNAGAADQTVVLYTRPTGATSWTLLGTTTTDASGGYATSGVPTKNTDFAAVFYGTANLGVSIGGPVSVTVTPLPSANVAIGADQTSVAKGGTFHVTTIVTPNAAGQTAQLQLLFGTTWVTEQTATLSAGSTAAFALQAGAKGSYAVRVFVASPAPGQGDGISATLVLTVT
jgi:hypothetical protein